jgi:hypothetical protein
MCTATGGDGSDVQGLFLNSSHLKGSKETSFKIMPSLLIKVSGKLYSQLLHSSDFPLYTNGGINNEIVYPLKFKFIEFSIRNSNTIMPI